MEQLPTILKRKKEIFNQYKFAVENIDGITLSIGPDYAENNHWLNLLQINTKICGCDRESIMNKFEENYIQVRPVWKLNHEQKPYHKCQSYKIEKAPELVSNSLCIPSNTNLTKLDINNVINNIDYSNPHK